MTMKALLCGSVCLALWTLVTPRVYAEDPPRHRNHLADESSPYLAQHAHNPVDWYPWGEAALERARRENKVIFLSIGYSSCHWCHVMEHESFTDEEIAGYLNEHFVCIKVDREERPDVDSIYMTAVQALHGSGGWPLSVFLTPQAKPFFGGTYFPARSDDRSGRIGLLTVLQQVHKAWSNERAAVQRRAKAVAEAVSATLQGAETPAAAEVDTKLPERTLQALKGQFDSEYGGFGYAAENPALPKFPTAPNLFFLLDQVSRGRDAVARDMLVKTLDRMAMGGIRDHLGGGFHRYATDRYWHIPHFEKMLYDNGQLASAYAEAYAVTGRPEYRAVVAELVSFLAREMTAPGGGLYAALDADSEGEEGRFYRWERGEWEAELGVKEADLFQSVYANRGRPNFEGAYFVPLRLKSWSALAEVAGRSKAELQSALRPLRQILLDARNRRVRPGRDTKVLTAWNGLAIRGLADAGRALGEASYVDMATRAAEFVLEHLRDEDGRLARTFSGGQPHLNGYLDDYAFLTDGLIALHRATGAKQWLDQARAITDKQLELFGDAEHGGFFFTSKDHPQLIARGKLMTSGARPAGAAVSAENLLYLARHLQTPSYRDHARRTILSAADLLSRSPTAMPRMAVAAGELVAQNDPPPAEE